MKDLTYSYTLKEVIQEDAECVVVIKCETLEEADAVAASLVDKGASVYTRKVV